MGDPRMESQVLDNQYKTVQDDVKTLHQEYKAISSDVKSLNSSQTALQGNVDTICSNMEKISKNVEEMMKQLQVISEEHQKLAVENMLHHKSGHVSAAVKKTLRKLAVGTVTGAMILGEYSAEKLACAREGLEDIIAEANYNNKIRKQSQKTDV